MITFKSDDKSLFKGMRGFTLIELLVTLAIVGMMMSAVYAVHLANVRAIRVEEDRVELQQDQRIAIDFMARELRKAGYDKAESLTPTIVDARSNFIYFTADLDNSGTLDGVGEHIAFCLYDSGTYGRSLSYVVGSDSDVGAVGSVVAGGAILIGHTHPNHQHEAFALVEEIEFLYAMADGTQTTDPAAGAMEDIRSVDVTILSRALDPDPRWTDNEVYVPVSGTAFNGGNPYGDNIRRRMITSTVRFRNMGL